jgi:polyisoprenyl-teichoic acid--peptidoglycan teichoic acid transferase
MSVDHRKADPDPSWRTDSIIVVAVDRAANRIGLVNIPRDLYVDIPGLGKGRINQADYYGEQTKYPGGGPALIGRVLSDTLGIPTQHWVRVQFDGLTRLVDTLGGITVTLDCPLYERGSKESAPNGVEEFYLPAGTNYLDGATAKKFATWRYVESDFGRTKRQQQVIWAIRQRALQIDAIPHIPAMWQAMSDAFTTDLGLFDVIKLASLGAALQAKDVHSVVLDLKAVDYAWTDEGASVLIIKDKAQLQRELDALWEGQSVASLGTVAQKSECPPPPTPVPTYTPRPTFTPTPTGTLTATTTVTGTILATATVQAPGDAISSPAASLTPTGTPTATPGA